MREPSQRGGPTGWRRAAVLLGVAAGVAAIAIVVAQGTRGRAAPRHQASPMVALGAQFLDAGMLEGAGVVTRFRLNGVPVSATSGASEASLMEVLGEAKAHCVADAPIDPLALAEALTAPQGHEDDAPLVLGRMVIDGEHGFVACLDRFAEPPARLAMRYAYARDVPGERVRFVVVWTDSPVSFAELARADGGEVAGDDVPGLPRPPGARRRWSFARADGSEHLVVYGVPDAGAIERWAARALPRAGWSDPQASGASPRVLSTERDGRHAYLVLREDETLVVFASRSRSYGEPQSPSL